ncbi:MAG: hypothetical protein E8D43_07765 [Nitrospira sp.]|nr:MAG: hypothetical protein E8D43_07765 [Nitrospira sp.]
MPTRRKRPTAASTPPAIIRPIDASRLKTYPLQRRHSKVQVSNFAKVWTKGRSFARFLNSLPDILAVKTLREVAQAIAKAHRNGRPVIVGMGAHVVKVGLGPLLVDLMERGIVTALAMNGAVIIHDFELAFMGHTSEEVDAEIDSGRFGMAEETGRMLNEAITLGMKEGQGLGESLGSYIHRRKQLFPHRATSLLATGFRLGLPVTVHVAVGPEVFLKAVSLGRNLGHPLTNITTVNMDFLTHYRPMTNVVRRPTQKGGKGYALTGHHEIMVPLLAAAVIEELSGR